MLILVLTWIASYGEQGFLLIAQTVRAFMSGLDTISIAPIEPNDFLLRVMVPEATLLLIMEDMDVSHEGALEILRKSRQYGLARYPEQDNSDQVDDKVMTDGAVVDENG
jgi:hypothetical protein